MSRPSLPPPAPPTGYQVQRAGGVDGEFADLALLAPAAQSYYDTSATVGTWRYRVLAVNEAGASVPSEVRTAVVSAPVEPGDARAFSIDGPTDSYEAHWPGGARTSRPA